MRTLVLLRGAPGCGKSTWLERRNMKSYAICPDDIRQMVAPFYVDEKNCPHIQAFDEKDVWDIVYDIAKVRFKNGEFTIIDATNSTTKEMTKWRDLAHEYKYHDIYLVDMTTIDITTCKNQNYARGPIKRVPDHVIDRMYSRFKTQKVPNGIKVISPMTSIYCDPEDLSSYKKIHVIGSIYGEWEILQKYFNDILLSSKSNDELLNDEDFYIFTGNYFGTDNSYDSNIETVKILDRLKDYNNVWLLESEKDRDMLCMTLMGDCQFMYTIINNGGSYEENDLKSIYNEMRQCGYFVFHNKLYLVNNGGIPGINGNLLKVPTRNFTEGTGDVYEVAKTWCIQQEIRPESIGTTQIFSNSNNPDKSCPMQMNYYVYNLERSKYSEKIRCIDIAEDHIYPRSLY